MNSLIYRPLTHWPELAAAFIEDLQQCQSHAAAAAFFAPLSPEEKSYLWQQCPQPLRQHLHRLKLGGGGIGGGIVAHSESI